jgi:hypothetical protein
MALTRAQAKLRNSIEDIASLISMDHWNIDDYEEGARTPYLLKMQRQLVLSEVIMKYTLIDELLTVIICKFYFRKAQKPIHFGNLWRTKGFRLFNHDVMDELYPLQKLRLVRDLKEVPKEVRETIERVNALRNALAHSFFPENRRQYMRQRRLTYRDLDIHTRDGLERFDRDVQVATDHLMQRAFGARPPKAAATATPN